jgi:hypothetical protein
METLVMFDQFWDFNRMVKDESPGKVEIMGSHPLFWTFEIRVYVMGMRCFPMGLTMFRPHL